MSHARVYDPESSEEATRSPRAYESHFVPVDARAKTIMSDEEVCGAEDEAGKTKGANDDEEDDDVLGRRVGDTASVDEDEKHVERRTRTTTTSSELEGLERKLSSKDFIMEPECLDHVKRYIASGGAPSTAIELLSENYRGYAAMTSLAAHWLKLTAPPKRGANTSPIKVSATMAGQRNGDANESTPTGGISAANEPTSCEKVEGDASANATGGNTTFDEMYFLETLVREKFDATMADRVFEGRPPAWLDGIFKSERGRALLFSLAESNPNCLLISCAIQHAWQRGMRHEVRALGPAAAAYFSIFHELLADHVKNIVLAGDDVVRRSDAEARVKSMCCQSIGTYAFGQMMLASLARGEVEDTASESARALATRLSQEIEEAAAGLHGAAAVRRLAPWLSATSEDANAKRATSDLLQARPVGGSASDVTPSAMAAGDLKKLRNLYFSDESKPSVAPLRHPDVLYNLITEAFKWNLSANRQRDACFDLIALAVSDETISVESVKKALNQAVEVVEVAKRGESPDKSSFAQAIEVPSAAAGIIATVRTALTNDEYHRIVQVGNTNALFIEMLGDIAQARRFAGDGARSPECHHLHLRSLARRRAGDIFARSRLRSHRGGPRFAHARGGESFVELFARSFANAILRQRSARNRWSAVQSRLCRRAHPSFRDVKLAKGHVKICR